jgi:hypothetical protein
MQLKSVGYGGGFPRRQIFGTASAGSDHSAKAKQYHRIRNQTKENG